MKVKHENIIKRDDGSQVKITALLESCLIMDISEYLIEIETLTKSYPIWVSQIPDDGKHATAEEILSVKLELWQSIKPEL